MFTYKKRVRFSSVIIASAIILSGCAGLRGDPELVIGNATEKQLRKVMVTSADRTYAFSNIEAFKVSDPKPRIASLAGEITVRWLTESGNSKIKTITLGPELQNYSGHMQLEVGADDSVRVFTAPPRDTGDSVLPWSMPANWEGSPSIPGMNN